jgi:hypothetical protein
MKNPNDVHY